jgi:RNA polymerase sigma-70 factor (ECF subfamily)
MANIDFESVLREHQGMVYSIAFNFFHNTAVAEEVAQDVFLKLYESRRLIKSDAHVVAWLRRTATHRCIDTLRRRGTWREVQLEDLPDIADESPPTDPLLQQKLRCLIASLPEKPRMALVLRYGEDMDVDEISRILDMPVRTVWSHLQRGIALVREKASRYLKEETNEPVRQRSS